MRQDLDPVLSRTGNLAKGPAMYDVTNQTFNGLPILRASYNRRTGYVRVETAAGVAYIDATAVKV